MKFTRITHNPAVMGGKPCIRGLRVTVGTLVGLLATGESREWDSPSPSRLVSRLGIFPMRERWFPPMCSRDTSL